MPDQRGDFFEPIRKSRTGGLNGYLRLRGTNGIIEVGADGDAQISIEPDGRSEIDTDMIFAPSKGTDNLQPFFSVINRAMPDPI